jgi:predicted HicB family RNase H-like nuclease
MMNTMTYKGYLAEIEYDDEDAILVGHISGIKDIVGFHAESVSELKIAFEESVDNYLAACNQLGQLPDKPSENQILLNITSDIHRAASISAEQAGKSLNQWLSEVLQNVLSSQSLEQRLGRFDSNKHGSEFISGDSYVS